MEKSYINVLIDEFLSEIEKNYKNNIIKFSTVASLLVDFLTKKNLLNFEDDKRKKNTILRSNKHYNDVNIHKKEILLQIFEYLIKNKKVEIRESVFENDKDKLLAHKDLDHISITGTEWGWSKQTMQSVISELEKRGYVYFFNNRYYPSSFPNQVSKGKNMKVIPIAINDNFGLKNWATQMELNLKTAIISIRMVNNNEAKHDTAWKLMRIDENKALIELRRAHWIRTDDGFIFTNIEVNYLRSEYLHPSFMSHYAEHLVSMPDKKTKLSYEEMNNFLIEIERKKEPSSLIEFFTSKCGFTTMRGSVELSSRRIHEAHHEYIQNFDPEFDPEHSFYQRVKSVTYGDPYDLPVRFYQSYYNKIFPFTVGEYYPILNRPFEKIKDKESIINHGKR